MPSRALAARAQRGIVPPPNLRTGRTLAMSSGPADETGRESHYSFLQLRCFLWCTSLAPRSCPPRGYASLGRCGQVWAAGQRLIDRMPASYSSQTHSVRSASREPQAMSCDNNCPQADIRART